MEVEGGLVMVYREDFLGKGGVVCFWRVENVEDLKSDFMNMFGLFVRVFCCDGIGIIMFFFWEVMMLGFM